MVAHHPDRLHELMKPRPRLRGHDLAKAGTKLDALATTPACGKTRRPRAAVEAEIAAITGTPGVRRVVTWQLTGDEPADLRLELEHRHSPPARRWKKNCSASTC